MTERITNKKMFLILGITIIVIGFMGLVLYQMHEQKKAALEELQILKQNEEARAKQEEEKRRAEEERQRAEATRKEAELAEKQRIEQQRKHEEEIAKRKEEEDRNETEKREKERQERTLKFTFKVPAGQFNLIPLVRVYKNDMVSIKIKRAGDAATGKVYLNFLNQDFHGMMSLKDGRWVMNGVFPIDDNDNFLISQDLARGGNANVANPEGVIMQATTNIINYFHEFQHTDSVTLGKLRAFQEKYRGSYYIMEVTIETNNPWNEKPKRIARED